MTIRHDGLRVRWLGYATVRIETPDGFVAYLDPGRYGVLTGEWEREYAGGRTGEELPHPRGGSYHARDGDLVCVTHVHHYDPDGIERVAADDATVVVYEGVDAAETGRDVRPVDELPHDVVRIGEEDHRTVGPAEVWTVPAYNEPDGPHTRDDGSVVHPRGIGVGYVVSLAGTPVFWPGDTDALAGFRELEVSLFLANISGTVGMDRHEAADLAAALDPDLVLPVHYNTREFLAADSGAFVRDVARRGVPVVLDERWE